MTGIKRIYKKSAMVKRPENSERPTKGLRRRQGRVIEDSQSKSRKLFFQKKKYNEPSQGGCIYPNAGE